MYGNHRVTLLAGGVGGARMARALRAALDPGRLTVIVNVGDDAQRYGVHVSADPDTMLYTLAGVEGPQGWGRAGDTTILMDQLTRLGIDASFTLGDLDFAACLARTLLLEAGVPLSSVIAALAEDLGIDDVRVLPATDDPLATWVRIADGTWLAFQEYFVDRGHTDAVTGIAYHGSTEADPAPGVLDAISECDTLVIAPSNPPLSVWPILAIDAIDDAVRAHDRTIAVSPLFGGRPLKGPADRVMSGIGLPSGTSGVLEAYRDRVDALVVDVGDARDASMGARGEVEVLAADTRLTGPTGGAEVVSTILEWRR